MKKLYMLSLTALLMAACAEEVTEKGNNGNFITFNVTDNNLLPEPTVSTAAAEVPSFFNQTTPQTIVTAPIVSTPEPVKVETDLQLDEPLYMTTTIEKGIRTQSAETSTMRGTTYTSGTLAFAVTEFTDADSRITSFTNEPFSVTPTGTVATGKTWEGDASGSDANDYYKFYAYSPQLTAGTQSNGLTLSSSTYNTITYDASAVTLSNQQDLMTAYARTNYTASGGSGKSVPLTFGHRLTAVTVQLNSSWSSNYTIKSIVFNAIDYSGTCSLADGSWSSTTNGNYTVNTITQSSTASANVAVNLMMIPQSLGTNAKMTITLQDNATTPQTHTLTASLDGTTWTAGHTVTYEIGAQGISTFQAVYPNGANAWGGTTQGPVSAYQTTAANANEAFGMYVADTDGNLVYSNIKMNVASVSSYTATLSVASNPGYFFSKSYRYFLYYPYKSTYDASSVTAKSGGVAVTDADTFLGNVSSGWDVKEDQSTEANYRLSDLQVAMQEGAEKDANNKLTISMKHRFGLAIIAMGSKSVPSTRTYNISSVGAFSFAYDAANTTCYAIGKFDGAQPYRVGTSDIDGTSKYYYIVNLVKTTNSYTLKSAYGTKYNTTISNRQWSDITISTSSNAITMGSYRNITVQPNYKNLGILYSYAGTGQTFAPSLIGCKYQMECWGASGGEGNSTYGKGSYVSGTISLMKNIDFYVCVGQQGVTTNNAGAWNGGGMKGTEAQDGSGGGATDIRTKEGLNSAQLSSWTLAWNNTYGLRGRILVAAGGGGSDDGAPASNNCSGGGLNSNATLYGGSYTNATQTAASTHTLNGEFGAGNQSYTKACAGGGGGYWGGSGSDYGGTGGSSYISGHPGCIAIASASSTSEKSGTANTVAKATHYSGLYFASTKMIDGTGHVWTTDIGSLEAMPNPTTASSLYSSGVGNRGNGYARITCLPYD